MISAIFFSTSTCQHCKPFKKIFEDVSEMYDEDELDVTYHIVDKDPIARSLAIEWQVQGVPTVIFVKDGVAHDDHRIVGAVPAEKLKNVIEGLVQRDVLQESSGGEPEGSCAVLCGTGQQTD